MKTKFRKASLTLIPALVIASLIGCQPDAFEGDGNGLTGPDLDASFTASPVQVDGKMNNY